MSANGIQVTISPAQQAKWASLCREWSREMRKSVPDVILWTGWKVAVSARSHTPKCKAKLGLRDLVPNPALLNPPTTWKGKPPAYAIARWRQGQIGPTFREQTDDPGDKRRVIKTAGAARNTWNGVMRGLGQPSGQGGGPGTGAGEASKHLSGPVPYVQLDNSLSYMPAIFPDAFPRSFDRVMRMMEARLTAQARKALAKGIRAAGIV